MNVLDLRNIIEDLIISNREDDYWDFKEKHHGNRANLIHDIICMANNRVDRDAYIIFGISDDTFDIIGVENDENRRNQQHIIDQLKSKKFISGIRPRVEMRTLIIGGHEIDVLIIKNSNDTPYYLIEDFKEQGRVVRAHHIYTRVGDTNTDIDKSADINNIEYLWKKRFFLTKPPFDQAIKKLEKKNEWQRDEDIFFNTYSPEFTITFEDDDHDNPEYYSYLMEDISPLFRIITLNYNGTKIYSRQSVTLEGGQYFTPVPDWGFLNLNKKSFKPDYVFKYFIKDEVPYKFNVFFYNEDDRHEKVIRRKFFEVILLFENLEEKNVFIKYVSEDENLLIQKLKDYENEYNWIEINNKHNSDNILFKLRTGKALNSLLDEYRNICNKVNRK